MHVCVRVVCVCACLACELPCVPSAAPGCQRCTVSMSHTHLLCAGSVCGVWLGVAGWQQARKVGVYLFVCVCVCAQPGRSKQTQPPHAQNTHLNTVSSVQNDAQHDTPGRAGPARTPLRLSGQPTGAPGTLLPFTSTSGCVTRSAVCVCLLPQRTASVCSVASFCLQLSLSHIADVGTHTQRSCCCCCWDQAGTQASPCRVSG